jgi:hypothetical protein
MHTRIVIDPKTKKKIFVNVPSWDDFVPPTAPIILSHDIGDSGGLDISGMSSSGSGQP